MQIGGNGSKKRMAARAGGSKLKLEKKGAEDARAKKGVAGSCVGRTVGGGKRRRGSRERGLLAECREIGLSKGIVSVRVRRMARRSGGWDWGKMS